MTTNTYDALNRVLTANTVCSDTSKNVSKSYVYDNMGRVQSKTANGVQTSYQYDIFGRIYQELSPKSFKGYFYEGVSQYAKEQLVGINHQTIYSSTQYEYDAEMRVIKVKESGNETASYTYDANGNKASETLANGVVSTYTYNGCNKITRLVTKSGNSTISEYEYSYYLDGSDACKVRSESGIIETTSYEYDGLKRLTEESVSNGTTMDTYAYEYDDYGNRSKMTATGSEEYTTVYDYNDANGNYTALLQKETKTVEETSSATTANGLATSPTELITNSIADTGTKETVYSYDANGNQITKTAEGKTETNTYDGLNQLIGFTDGETTASYTYNADGLRTSKTVDGETINHIWDGSKQIIVDMDDSDWYSAEVYVRGTNLLAKFSKQSGNVKTDYQYYTQNAHGDVVDLTDADGEIVKSYTYDAFGVEKNIDDADTNAFRYCGEYYDAETGTIYLRARYYNSSTGRFITRDSFPGKCEDPLSLNLYTYCGNNPICFEDPLGHSFDAVKEFLSNVAQYFSSVGSNVCGQVSSNADKYACLGGVALADGPELGPADAVAIVGAAALTVCAIGIGAYEGTIAFSKQKKNTKAKEEADTATKAIPQMPGVSQVYYHYTNEENAMMILATGMILPDEKRRVYLTPNLYSPDEVNDALFMGTKDSSYGEYRVEVRFKSSFDPCLDYNGGTQPNEIVYHGTIRNGRNATITVVKNNYGIE